MLKTAPQFRPEKQIDNSIGELEKALRDAAGVLARLDRLKTTLVSEVSKLQAEREALEIYTEEEAAMLLRLDERPAQAKRALADLRKKLELPHLSFGNKPRYTKEQLQRICSILEIKPSRKHSLRNAA